MNGPTAGESQRENCTNCSKLDHMTECLGEVNTRPLNETTKHPRLIALQRTIGMKLMFEYSLANNDVALRGLRNQIPSVVANESNVLLFHSSRPIWIGESCTVAAGNRIQC